MSSEVGFRDSSASSGPMMSHLSPFLPSGGRPRPKPLSSMEKSRTLNQSPELYESRSRLFERSMSEPACQNDTDCDSAVVESATLLSRTRSFIGVSAGSLNVNMSKKVSLS